jgi:Fe2+ or Zn2+ uptake regulation protein
VLFLLAMATGSDKSVALGADRLRSVGLRVTASRLAVLAAVQAGDHLPVEEIALSVRQRIGSISTQATYDALAALVRVGLVRRIEPAGSPARFETRVADNHHHLICRHCGVAVDVDCAALVAPCLQPPDLNGFVVDEAEVVFWGTCATCQEAAHADAKVKWE